jgi:predicted ATPase
MWLFRSARGEMTAAQELVDELLGLARREANEIFQLEAHHAGWTTFTYLGDLETAINHTRRGTAIYRPKEHGLLAADFGGHDPGVCAKAHASQPLWLMGYPDRAIQSSEQSLALARELKHGASVIHALFHAVWLDQFRRDHRAAQARAEAVIGMASDQGQLMYLAMGTVFLGWASAVAGQAETGIKQVREGIDRYRATGAEAWAPYYSALLADLLWRVGRAEEALGVLHDAQTASRRIAERYFWEAELLRLEGELLLSASSGNVAEAEVLFQQAIAKARDRHSKSLELRASTSLARLRRDRATTPTVGDQLASIYGWFTEGFDTLDLKEASALLDELHT